MAAVFMQRSCKILLDVPKKHSLIHKSLNIKVRFKEIESKGVLKCSLSIEYIHTCVSFADYADI